MHSQCSFIPTSSCPNVCIGHSPSFKECVSSDITLIRSDVHQAMISIRELLLDLKQTLPVSTSEIGPVQRSETIISSPSHLAAVPPEAPLDDTATSFESVIDDQIMTDLN